MKNMYASDRHVLFEDDKEYKSSSLFIEAGAGAGKSTSMVGRIVYQLKQGIKPERFVVITFTNKSAEDMLGKINEAIEEEAKKDPRFKGVLNELYKMNISTIHSFCNKLLSENSFDAKLSYAPILLEDEEEEAKEIKAFNIWRRSLTPGQNTEIYDCPDDKPFNKIKNLYLELCKLFDNAEVVYECSMPKTLHADAKSYITKVYELLQQCNGKTSDAANKFLDLCDVAQTDSDDNNEQIRACFSKINKKVLPKMGSAKVDEKEELQSIRDELTDFYNSEEFVTFKAKFEAYYKCHDNGQDILNRYAMSAWEFYKRNRATDTLSNNQLIYEVYKMLQDKDICRKVAKNYDVIYVDEFQDTDSCQIDLVKALAFAIEERKREEGNKTMTLFLVGDPKQSIYRFRGADFRSFMAVRNEFENLGTDFKSIFFPDNFRSNNFVIDYVNDVYRQRTFTEDKNYPFVYEDMKCNNFVDASCVNDISKSLAGVYPVEFGDKTTRPASTARLIKKLVDEKYQIFDARKKVFRDVKYKDFLVITTAKTQIAEYVKEFNKNGIKTNVSGQVDLSGSTTVLRIISRLLPALLNETNSNNHIADHIINKYFKGDKQFLEDLRSRKFTPYGILVYLLNNFDLTTVDFTDEEAYTYRALSSQIIENLSVNQNSNGPAILDEFVKLMEEAVEEQLIVEEEADAVKIMNAHKTKGLEANIVIVAASGSFATNKGVYTVGGKTFLKCIDLHPLSKEQNAQESNEEKLRLEYVVATRAKQVLIFETTADSDTLFFRKGFEYDFSAEFLGKYHLEGTSLPDFENEIGEQGPTRYSVQASGFSAISNELLNNELIETSPSALEKEKDPVIGKIRTPRRPADNIFGTALHRVMELYVRNPNASPMSIIDLAISEAEEPVDVLSYETGLKECLKAIKKLFDETKLLDGYAAKPEMKFISVHDGVLMNGSIDLLLLKDDEAKIIDYKSDVSGFTNVEDFEKNLKKAYTTQLNAYEEEVQRMFPELKTIKKQLVWVEEKDVGSVAHLLDI